MLQIVNWGKYPIPDGRAKKQAKQNLLKDSCRLCVTSEVSFHLKLGQELEQISTCVYISIYRVSNLIAYWHIKQFHLGIASRASCPIVPKWISGGSA